MTTFSFLAAERGIRQFLDSGSGLPAASNVHEIAQEVSPDVRVVYVDNDPVVVLLFAVLQFVPDADDPRALLARFRDVMVTGSALALSHVTDENFDEEAGQAGRAVHQGASAPIEPRSRAQIEGFFDGAAPLFYGGVAVKPAGLETPLML